MKKVIIAVIFLINLAIAMDGTYTPPDIMDASAVRYFIDSGNEDALRDLDKGAYYYSERSVETNLNYNGNRYPSSPGPGTFQ